MRQFWLILLNYPFPTSLRHRVLTSLHFGTDEGAPGADEGELVRLRERASLRGSDRPLEKLDRWTFTVTLPLQYLTAVHRYSR